MSDIGNVMRNKIIDLAYKTGIIQGNVNETDIADFATEIVIYCVEICKGVEEELYNDSLSADYTFMGATMCIEHLIQIFGE